VDFEGNRDDPKTSVFTGMDDNLTSYEIALTTPEELENKRVKLGQHPIGHVNKGRHVPDSRKCKGISNQGLATI